MTFRFLVYMLLPILTVSAQIIETTDQIFEQLADALFWESRDGQFAVQVGGQFDAVAYTSNDPGNAPGFFFPEAGEHSALNPRLEMTVDVFAGEYITAFAKARWDHGVHPGVAQFYGGKSEFRVDEFYIKARLGDTGASLRAGQFTPQIGGFMTRQSTWDNSLISYPLVYENVTSITDYSVPLSDASFANRANAKDVKLKWVPILWAPLYPRGASVDGSVGDFSYSLNFLNSNISSRGVAWNDNTWDDPTWAGRIGYQPTPNWDLGLSFATGAYLRDPLTNRDQLPNDFDRGEYTQDTLGIDIRYAARKWQIWAEIWASRFEIPGFSEAPEVYSYLIEGRHEVSRKTWVSLRWNQEFYNRLEDRITGETYRKRHKIIPLDSFVCASSSESVA